MSSKGVMRRFGSMLIGAGLTASSCLLPSVEISDALSGPPEAGTSAGGAVDQGGDESATPGGISSNEPAGADGGALEAAGGVAAGAGGAGGQGSLVPATSGPSCAALSETACHGESCCTRLAVPGCTACAFPVDQTTSISAFELDKYEVTVGRFRAFVKAYQGPPEANAGAHPKVAKSGWNSDWDVNQAASADDLENALVFRPCPANSARAWTIEPGESEQKPANCMSWYEAFAFCAWDGGFLPTEAEWQFAATGGTENRMYPWVGTTLDAAHALYGACGMGVSSVCNLSSILEVGSKPAGAGKWGHLDLSGSVWEWLLDSPSGMFLARQPCEDCASLGVSTSRSIRGGSWTEDVSFMPAARRTDDPADSTWDNVGIRCAYSP